MPIALPQNVLKLGSEMLQFTSSIETLSSPSDVLDGLQKVTFQCSQPNVLGAALLPVRWGDWCNLEKGETVFLHKSTPEDWWDEERGTGPREVGSYGKPNPQPVLL